MMVKKNLQSSWDATNGLIAHSITKPGEVEAMNDSGCIGCYIGIESGNREILKKIKHLVQSRHLYWPLIN